MDPSATAAERAAKRRRTLKFLNWNSALGTIGTSIAMAPLLLYFGGQRTYTVPFRELMLLLAAVVACVRLAAPWLMRLQDSARQVAVAGTLFSALVLAILPLVFWRYSNIDEDLAMNVHAAMVSIAIAGEAISAVAIWSWIGQICPARSLGKYLGRREALRAIAAIAGLGVIGAIAYFWRSNYFTNFTWQAPIVKLADFAPAIWCGSAIHCGAALLLLPAIDVSWRQILNPSEVRISWRSIFPTPTLTRLLLFGCWTSFFGAMTIPASNYYPRFELDLTWRAPLMLLGITLLGQVIFCSPIGSACDRFGSLSVIFAAQLLAAVAPLFAIPATLAEPFWIVGMPIFQVAQVGVVLGLMRLVLKFNAAEGRPMQLAVFLSAIAVAHAAGVTFGELILEALSYHHFVIGGWRLDEYGYAFYIGGMTRLMGVVLLLGLTEPGKSSPLGLLRPGRWLPPKSDAVGDPAPHPLD